MYAELIIKESISSIILKKKQKAKEIYISRPLNGSCVFAVKKLIEE